MELQVEYQGEPAAGAQVALIYGFAEENESPRVKDADDQGKVAFEFEKPGYYLAMVKRRDGDDHREGYYDCRYYTATLFMMVTK